MSQVEERRAVTEPAGAHSLDRMPRRRIEEASDRGLVEQMAGGDAVAYRELLARYRSTVYATAYATLLDPELVEATVADIFVEARRTAPGFLDSHGSVSGWLTHLTRLCIAARMPPPPRANPTPSAT